MTLPGEHPLDVTVARDKAQMTDHERRISTLERNRGTGLVAVTFQNSWANQGGSYPTAAYWKDTNGVVRLRGTILGTSATANPAFTLPAGFRPGGELDFICVYIPSAASVATVGVLQVKADGTVNPIIGANYGTATFSNTMRFVDLNVVQFLAEG